MNRHIKFRVWNTRNKEFFIQGKNQRLDLALHYWETNKHVEYPQQFTGLIDKNGKEIYERDIVKIYLTELGFWVKKEERERIGEVIYDVETSGYIVKWKEGEGFAATHLNRSTASEGEIIGNIHENPE